MDSVLEFIKSIPWWGWVLVVLVLVAIKDIFFSKTHTILHNFPVVGHFRYILESIGPELRQYIVANNREELPFNRIERGWIYASAKNENNYEGFGTDRDIYEPNYIFVNNTGSYAFSFNPSAQRDLDLHRKGQSVQHQQRIVGSGYDCG